MAKVFIGVGHGGSDPGAVKYIVEKDIALKQAKACRDYLKKAGVETMLSRETDVTEDLTVRIKKCNTFKPDCALDVHNNAGGGDGFEVYHSINGGKGKDLAKCIEAEVIKIGQNSRGLKTRANSRGTDYFGFIREISCPSIICEGVFVDNKADASQCDEDHECKAFGEAYAKGILKYLGISDTKKTESKVEDKKETESSKTTTSSTNLLKKGAKLNLKNIPLYATSDTQKKSSDKTGTYYIWSSDVIANRIRITNAYKNVGKAGQITGWINIIDAINSITVSSTTTKSTFKEYKVKVNTDALNIRSGAGTNYKVIGTIKDRGTYTIIDESKGTGADKWGKLKSGTGWIALDFCKKV